MEGYGWYTLSDLLENVKQPFNSKILLMGTSGKTEASETAHWPRELNVDVR